MTAVLAVFRVAVTVGAFNDENVGVVAGEDGARRVLVVFSVEFQVCRTEYVACGLELDAQAEVASDDRVPLLVGQVVDLSADLGEDAVGNGFVMRKVDLQASSKAMSMRTAEVSQQRTEPAESAANRLEMRPTWSICT